MSQTSRNRTSDPQASATSASRAIIPIAIAILVIAAIGWWILSSMTSGVPRGAGSGGNAPTNNTGGVNGGTGPGSSSGTTSPMSFYIESDWSLT